MGTSLLPSKMKSLTTKNPAPDQDGREEDLDLLRKWNCLVSETLDNVRNTNAPSATDVSIEESFGHTLVRRSRHIVSL